MAKARKFAAWHSWHFEAKSVPNRSAPQSTQLFMSKTCSGGLYVHTDLATKVKWSRSTVVVVVQYSKFGISPDNFLNTHADVAGF